MPVTWGRSRIGSNAAPPLKSTRRNDTRSGGWHRAIAVSHARRNSLLPLPVVPATIACGPRPTRSSSSAPSAVTPTATRRVAREPAGVAGWTSERERHAVGQRGMRSDSLSDRRRARGRRPRAGLGRGEEFGHDRATHGALAAPLDVRAGGRLHLDDRLEPRRQEVDLVGDGDRRRVAERLATRDDGPAAPLRGRGARLPRAGAAGSPPTTMRRRREPRSRRHPGGTGSRPARSGRARTTGRAATAPRRRSRARPGARTGASSSRAAASSTSRSSASTGVPSMRSVLRTVPRPSTTCPTPPSRQSIGSACSTMRRAGATRRHAAARS